MSESRSHNDKLTDVGLYLSRKSDDKEQYEFERILQQDPFMAEAVEGMSEFKFSDIEKDIHKISLIKKSRKFPWKFFVGVVAVLVIAALIYLVSTINFSGKSKADNKEEDRIEDKLVFNAPEEAEPIMPDSIHSAADDSLKTQVKPQIMTPSADLTNGTKNTQIKPIANQVKDNSKIATKQLPARQVSAQEINSEEKKQTSEQTGNSNNQEPANYVSDNQPVVNQPETTKSTPVVARPGVSAKPAPLGGETLYKSYIDNTLKYPSSVEEKSKETVRLKFTVSASGDVQNFQLIKGPDNSAFVNEAIRVIKSGPKWAPAIKDGIPVEEEVTLKINFKPE